MITIGWENFQIRDYMREKFKLPVIVNNDANVAGYGEAMVGVAKECESVYYITLSTGVGGGFIVNNQLLKGKNGAAGEVHFKMYSDKRRKCTCGSWDCFEIYTSGTGLRITAQEMLNNPEVTTYDVIDGVNAGDSKMLEVYHRWEDDITNGIIGLANIFDPDCVVLSGSMAQFVETEKIEQNVNKEIVTTPTRVVKGSAGNYSGMIGAALLAFKKGVV